ncbi:molecular chaperone DnaJ [Actinoplanes sp. G11-F43]|uniref:molecular chaperone DnaJ n=1 Tax=Actinoplanes sp. G11-F43 TaxID=3424130 RepID=UPI003D339D25
MISTARIETLSFDEAVARISAARDFRELGEKRAFKKWAKLVHPDTVGVARQATATDAFAKLAHLYKRAERAPVLHGRRRTYRMDHLQASGDLAELYVDGSVLIKVPRSAVDNDLMETEAATLRRLWSEGDPKFRAYAPRLIESFICEDGQRHRRRVNVMEYQAEMITLAEVGLKERDPRDVAWMWRRLLTALGWAHRAGVTHGAILPEHVLIHPEQHGLVLVDWCYAGHRPAAIVKARLSDYPPEVLNDRLAGPATDIYMATGLMTRLIGPRMPAPLRRFAAGCMYDAPRMRPQDAWALLGEFDELIHRLYGPRKFRPFVP